MPHSSVGRPAPGPPGPTLSHVDDEGRARMVDVSGKAVTDRTAVARSAIRMQPETLALIREARTACIQGLAAPHRPPDS